MGTWQVFKKQSSNQNQSLRDSQHGYVRNSFTVLGLKSDVKGVKKLIMHHFLICFKLFLHPAIFLILLPLALQCFQIGSRLRLHTLFITKISAQTWDCLCSEVNIQHNNPFHLLFNLFHNVCLSTEALAPLTSMRNMFLRNHKSSIRQPSHALSNLLRKTEKPGNSKQEARLGSEQEYEE